MGDDPKDASDPRRSSPMNDDIEMRNNPQSDPQSDPQSNLENRRRESSRIPISQEFSYIKDKIMNIINLFSNIVMRYESNLYNSGNKSIEKYYEEFAKLVTIEENYKLTFNNLIKKIINNKFSEIFKCNLIVCLYLHYYIENSSKLTDGSESYPETDKEFKKILSIINSIIDTSKEKNEMNRMIEKIKKEDTHYNNNFFELLNKNYTDDDNKIKLYILYLLHNYYTDKNIVDKLIIRTT